MDNLRLSLSNTKNNCESMRAHTLTHTLLLPGHQLLIHGLSLSVFSQTPILQALQHVQASCDEAHKMRYSHARTHTQSNVVHNDIICSPSRFSDLFALAEEYEDSQAKPPKSRRKAPVSSPRFRKGAAPPTNEEESASSTASVRLKMHSGTVVWLMTGLLRTCVLCFRRKRTRSPKLQRGRGKARQLWALIVTDPPITRQLSSSHSDHWERSCPLPLISTDRHGRGGALRCHVRTDFHMND